MLKEKFYKFKLFSFGVVLPFGFIIYVNGYCDSPRSKSKSYELVQSSFSEENVPVKKYVLEFEPFIVNVPGDDSSQIVEAKVSLELLLSEKENVLSKENQIKDILTFILINQKHQSLMDTEIISEIESEIKDTVNSILSFESVLKVDLECQYSFEQETELEPLLKETL